jgi:anion-transporting  ArsA/GET3 family ATPase
LNSAPPDPTLLDRRLCFVLGKGGAGKSTVSAAIGLRAADKGLRTLIIEVAAQHQITTLFGLPPSGGDERRDVEVQLAADLWTLSIDPAHATEEYLSRQLKVRPVVEMLTRSKAFSQFASAAPGLAELVTLGKTWSLAVELRPGTRQPVWDRIIVDCPATGHGIALLDTAQNIEELAGEGPIRDQAGRIREVVSHPAATGVALVARPEELSVTEAIEAAGLLRHKGLPLAAAVMNGMRPARFGDDEEPVLSQVAGGADAMAARAASAALEHLRGQRHDRRYLRRLGEGTAVPVLPLEQLVRGRMERDGLRRLGARLENAA